MHLVNRRKIGLILIAILMLGFTASWAVLSAAILANCPANTSQSTVISSPKYLPSVNSIGSQDLDGDNHADYISSHADKYNYHVAVELSNNLTNTFYFSLTNSSPDINIFAYDIDKDNDKDIVITSAFSSQPLGIWLNDGKGKFQQDKTIHTSIVGIHDSLFEQVGCLRVQLEVNPENQVPFVEPTKTTIAQYLARNVVLFSSNLSTYTSIALENLPARGPPQVIL